jgi:hypothetical protein
MFINKMDFVNRCFSLSHVYFGPFAVIKIFVKGTLFYSVRFDIIISRFYNV